MFTFKEAEIPIILVQPENDVIFLTDEREKDNFKGKTFNNLEMDNSDESFLSLIPTRKPETRDCIYICGKSGSGKSYFCRQFMQNYSKIYPKRKIYVFSALDSDPAYDDLDIERITLDEEFGEIEDPDYSDLEKSLVVFDDIDRISNKKIYKNVVQIQNMCLELGRKKEISMLNTSHISCDYRKSRVLLNEANYICLFYVRSNGANKYYLEKKSGLDKSTIKKICELETRWVCLKCDHPGFYFWEKGISKV